MGLFGKKRQLNGPGAARSYSRGGHAAFGTNLAARRSLTQMVVA